MELEYQFERLDFSQTEDMQKLLDLQNAVYAGKHIFTSSSFQHWYLDNPNGRVVSFNALYGNIIASHYALVPVKMEIEGRVVLGLLSMATVTHPDHRGRGLFKKLAKMSYDYAAQNGFEFVVGVANANSYPGFIKYFDFQDIAMLEVLFGCRKGIKESSDKNFRVYWDKESIRWRLGDRKYYKDDSSAYGTYPIWKFKKSPFVYTYMGSVSPELLDALNNPKACSVCRPFKLYVGLGSNARELGYKEVPKFIKHSPFHLIFMDLTGGKLPKMTKDNVFFQLMDFDVA
jgi:GNAT superfamily N-acetyltransferase